MSDRLFSPTYRIPGVVYSGKKDEIDVKNSSSRHLQQLRRQPEDTNMSVRPDDDNGGKLLNPNSYATRKTVAQGMLDIALLTANASQLRYVLSLGERHENYSLMIGLIVTSLVLQLMVAFFSLSLSMLRDCCLENHEYKISALFINYINVISVFLIAVINIIMTAFGVYPTNVSLDPPIFT